MRILASRWIIDRAPWRLNPGFGGISQALIDRKGVCRGAVGMTVLASTYDTPRRVQTLL